MDIDQVWQIIDEERLRLAPLLEDLSEAEWRTPSLCSAWTVRDVAAHVTQPPMNGPAVAVAMLRARGSFDRMIRDTALRQARLPVREFPERLRKSAGSRRTPAFTTAMEPLLEVLCHAQDIARPLGRPYPMPPEAALAAADHVWQHSFPFRAQRRLRGWELVAGDVPWRAGSGLRVEGPISALLMLMTGRTGAIAELSGPGVAALHARFDHHLNVAPPGR
jgi:uncharacterized protein (TIGR03083 family)